MPVTVNYPGVYIEELPSSVRTIVGVPTSVTAFVGRALRGPTNEPHRISSWTEFERMYGGIWSESTMSYSVYQFFQNGGSDAVILRLYHRDENQTANAVLDVGNLTLEAAYPGAWGKNLRATVDLNGSQDVADGLGVALGDLFNLTVRDLAPGGATEVYRNLTVVDSARRIDRILAAQSTLVRLQAKLDPDPTKRPKPAAGYDSASTATKQATDSVQPAKTALKTAKDNLDKAKLTDENTQAWKQVLDARQQLGPANDALKAANDALAAAEKELAAAKAKNDQQATAAAQAKDDAATQAQKDASDKVKALTKQRDDNAAKLDETQKAHLKAQDDLAAALVAVRSAADILQASDGLPLGAIDFTGDAENPGFNPLEQTDIFNLLVVAPFTREIDVDDATLDTALQLCVKRRAILLVDPPSDWVSVDKAEEGAKSPPVVGVDAWNAAIYFPRLIMSDPTQEGRLATFAPSGAVAGVIARTDSQAGVWKAPAGTDASLNGVRDMTVRMLDAENGRLNPLGINCLRQFPVYGPLVWGARTLRGADQLADQWKYLPVRRTALFIEESLFRGTKWAVFMPNDEPLWAAIRLNVGAFMNSLFRQGAFQGKTPQEAYVVKCDHENNPQNDIDKGIVHILVGFAPLKPAEFVIIQIQQLAGQLQV